MTSIDREYNANDGSEIEAKYQHLKGHLLQLRRMTSSEAIILVMSKLNNRDERALFEQSIHGLSLFGLQVKCAQVLALLQGQSPFELPTQVRARETVAETIPMTLPGGGMMLPSKSAPTIKPQTPTAIPPLVNLALMAEIPLAVLKNPVPREMASTVKPKAKRGNTNRDWPENEADIKRPIMTAARPNNGRSPFALPPKGMNAITPKEYCDITKAPDSGRYSIVPPSGRDRR